MMDTPYRRGDRHRYYSSSDFDRHYDRHNYHLYRRNNRGHFLDEFKKENPPAFHGKMNKSIDAEAWLLACRNSLNCMIT